MHPFVGTVNLRPDWDRRENQRPESTLPEVPWNIETVFCRGCGHDKKHYRNGKPEPGRVVRNAIENSPAMIAKNSSK